MTPLAIALALHTLAAVVWVGGMTFAYCFLRPVAGRALDGPQRLALWRGVFAGFFPVVWIAVAVLLLSGYYMVLGPFGGRAAVIQTGGGFSFDRPDASQDRVVATYVLDLLSDADIRTFLDDAHRLLAPGGRLCVAGLTEGGDPLSRLVARLWDALHALRPAWVGGCRPTTVRPRLASSRWRIVHHEVVTPWCIPSEVLVATRI